MSRSGRRTFRCRSTDGDYLPVLGDSGVMSRCDRMAENADTRGIDA